MNIDAGELNKRITILEVVRGQDSDGYPTPTEQVVRKCAAKFSRISGKELLKNNADYGDATFRFLIRYAPGINRKQVVRYNGNDYEIEYPNDYGDSHEYIELICRTLTNKAEP